jgi:uncharacterized membrane protein
MPTTEPNAQVPTIGLRPRRFGLVVMGILSTLIAVVASRYLQLDPSTYFEEQRETYVARETVLVLHVGGAIVALLVGPWQFSRRLRRHGARVHRVLGVTYAVACLVGGSAGVALSTTAHGGAVASVGFALLGAAWLATTALAVRAVVAGRYADHRRWMIRSFSLCFAAVTLRLYLGVFGALEAAELTGAVTFTTAYVAIAWLCWVPNLAVGWRISNRPAAA